jgi:hypothetical protein
MVERTRLNVTLCGHCLYVLLINYRKLESISYESYLLQKILSNVIHGDRHVHVNYMNVYFF